MMKTMGLYPSEEMAEAMQSLLPSYWNKMEEDVGVLYSRPELNLKMREVATISALVVMGSALPQLKVHIKAGLHVGLTETEIKEIILQMVASQRIILIHLALLKIGLSPSRGPRNF